jgi:hypothetical protein
MGTFARKLQAFSLGLFLAGGSVLAAANWSSPTYTLTTSSPISAVGQVRTGSINVAVDHDTTCTLSISGSPTLTKGSATLTTAYKLTGPGWVTNQDGTWVDATTFLTHTYGITNAGPVTTTLTLEVQATPPPNRAPDAGVYSATVVLTVTW